MSAPGGLVRAAGGVLWRPTPVGLQIALIHRSRYDDWSLPKGKLDPGEHELEAAVREVHEETACRGVPGRRLTEIRYHSLAGPKVVRYWVMRAVAAAELTPNDEVDGLGWLTPEQAERQLTYPHDIGVVREFATATADALVLLVRHGSAGDRGAWRGPDVERPLDGVGLRQADRLARMLALFAPRRVLSADPLRCVQTAEPVAARLGVPVEVEHAFSEEGYSGDPARALRHLRALARVPDGTAPFGKISAGPAPGAERAADARTPVSVVCAQGGGIPDMVATLAGEDGLELPHYKSRKGSVWALSFRDGLLLAADYYADFDPPD
jgi:8-oxo-(d)GTP phosphatase